MNCRPTAAVLGAGHGTLQRAMRRCTCARFAVRAHCGCLSAPFSGYLLYTFHKTNKKGDRSLRSSLDTAYAPCPRSLTGDCGDEEIGPARLRASPTPVSCAPPRRPCRVYIQQ